MSILKLFYVTTIITAQLLFAANAQADAAFNDRWVICTEGNYSLRFLFHSNSDVRFNVTEYRRAGMRMVRTGEQDPKGVYFGFCSTKGCRGVNDAISHASSVNLDFDRKGNITISVDDGMGLDSSGMVITIEGVGIRGELLYRVDSVMGTCRTNSLRNM